MIEERWIVENRKLNSEYARLVVTFLSDLQWQNGRKIVYEIAISKDAMMVYQDRKSEVLAMGMGRGYFDDKIDLFWSQFENKIV